MKSVQSNDRKFFPDLQSVQWVTS